MNRRFPEWHNLVHARVMQSHRLPFPVRTDNQLGRGMAQLQTANCRRIKQSITEAGRAEDQNQARLARDRS
jgi:hypothetical protein